MSAYALQRGDTIADYTIDSLIGRGGMGVVYLATQRRLSRKVALKILSPDLSHDPEFRDRFARESAIAASLEHPNVLPVHDAGTTGDVLYLAMRYVDGPDLRDLLARARTLTPARTLTIVREVGGALDAAHARGLIHRDVKPGNILISHDGGHVYLADFGLARTADGAGMTQSGSFLGSVAYCSPEQIEGLRLDGRSDLYALACVAFECLTGSAPFPRASEVAVVKAHLNDPPSSVTTFGSGLSGTFDPVFETALSKQPTERFGSAHEFVDALECALDGVEPRAHLKRLNRPVAAPTVREASPMQPPSAGGGAPDHRRRTSVWIWSAAAAVVVALLGGTVAWMALRNPTETEATTTSGSTPVVAQVPLERRVAPRLEALALAQSRVNTSLNELTSATENLDAVLQAGAALERAILAAQGFSAGLEATGASDRALLQLFDTALERHARYAARLVFLPEDAAFLTTQQTDELVAAGEEADAAYERLAAESPSLPTVPVSYTHDARLALAVPDTSLPTETVPTRDESTEPTTTETSPELAVPGLTTLTGRRFSVAYPASWRIDVREAKVSYGYDTTIRDSDVPESTYLRVDYTPNARVSDAWDAALGQRAAASSRPGYREIDFSRTTFQGYDATRWEFEVVSDGVRIRKIDMFFIDETGTGWAVLVQAPSSDFPGWQGTFDAIYESFVVR